MPLVWRLVLVLVVAVLLGLFFALEQSLVVGDGGAADIGEILGTVVGPAGELVAQTAPVAMTRSAPDLWVARTDDRVLHISRGRSPQKLTSPLAEGICVDWVIEEPPGLVAETVVIGLKPGRQALGENRASVVKPLLKIG